MSSPEDIERRLDVTYRYFSHHIRTCTSVVVAMLDVVAEGLTDKSMTDMIMESGYLLDLYDRGMSVCFNHVLGKPHDIELEEVDIALLTGLYIKNAVSQESAAVNSRLNGVSIRCDAYSFKSLFQILLQEGLASSAGELKVTHDENKIYILPDKGYNEIQPIFTIFAEIFERTGIVMSYDKTSIILRFHDESINCR
ncbi:MAG: hypothetical protein AB7F25_04815 [Deferribacterales bacterium]